MSHSGKTHTDLPRITAGDRVGEVLAGRYRLLRELGAGQMARVFVAEQMSMGRNVAVKIMRDDAAPDDVAVERFRREMMAVSRLRSPHTIRFYDAGTSAGARFIAMELLAGETLRQRLERGALAPELVVDVVAQIGASLEEAHEAGVLHRDLKPENVYFCDHPTPMRTFVKVLDFGLAKLTDPDAKRLTGECQTVGTPAYMAPETIVRQRVVDHRADVYGLGVLAYEMLTGERPFRGKTPMQMMLNHVNAPIPEIAGASPGLNRFFASALAKEPAARPQRATEVAVALAAALAEPAATIGG